MQMHNPNRLNRAINDDVVTPPAGNLWFYDVESHEVRTIQLTDGVALLPDGLVAPPFDAAHWSLFSGSDNAPSSLGSGPQTPSTFDLPNETAAPFGRS